MLGGGAFDGKNVASVTPNPNRSRTQSPNANAGPIKSSEAASPAVIAAKSGGDESSDGAIARIESKSRSKHEARRKVAVSALRKAICAGDAWVRLAPLWQFVTHSFRPRTSGARSPRSDALARPFAVRFPPSDKFVTNRLRLEPLARVPRSDAIVQRRAARLAELGQDLGAHQLEALAEFRVRHAARVHQ